MEKEIFNDYDFWNTLNMKHFSLYLNKSLFIQLTKTFRFLFIQFQTFHKRL